MGFAEKIKQQRKTAFEVGFARYCHENDLSADLETLTKEGRIPTEGQLKTANPLIMAALLPSVISYGAGNAAGGIGGKMYGMASDVSSEGVGEREYELAESATQQLIDELKAKRHNQDIQRILSSANTRQAKHPALGWAQ